MKVAIYARVSTEQQIENYSISLQKERMRAFCSSKGWNDITEYVDRGYSGSNLNRPALRRLEKDIRAKKVDAVVVYRLDRLSRSQRDTLYLIEEMFLPNGIEFISISETIDTSTPFGRAMIGIMSIFAQLERETITERLRSGRLKMVKDEGLWAGGADASPYGYTRLPRGELVINEKERDHIVRIFEEYVLLKSYIKVQKKLQKEGFPELRPQRITALLKNRLYIGEVSFAGEWFKGAHEPIISLELFNEAQRVNEHFKGYNFVKIKNNVFRQKVVCGCCGENYVVYGANSKLANGDKVTYYYMMCRRRKMPRYYDSKCHNRTIKRSDLEDEVFARIQNLEKSSMKKLLIESEKSKTERSMLQKYIKNGIPNLWECNLDTQTAIVDLFIDKIIVQEDGIQVIWSQ